MFHVARHIHAFSSRGIVIVVTLIAILSCQPSARAATVTWDDGATDPPNPPGDGISWNDKFNWDTDMIPAGVDDVVLTTELVKVQDGNSAFAATLSAGATDLVVNGSLTVFGSSDHDTTITVVASDDSPTSGAAMTIGEGSTLGGNGEVLLGRTGGVGSAHATFGSTGSGTSTQGAGHTIRGEGLLNANLINNGLIQAEDLDGNAGSLLIIGNTLQNNSVVRTSPTAGIRIGGNITQSATGQVIADANVVEYQLGVISGGTLESENGGSFLFPVDGTIRDLTNNAAINVVTGATGIDLFVSGTGLTNNGTITINSNNMNGSCIITFQTTQTLDGTGEIVLNRWNTSGSAGATLFTSVGATVTQAAGHTIRGEGLIASALVNDGLVEAMDANGDGEGLLRITANTNGSANALNNNIFRAAENGIIDLIRLDQTSTGRLIAADGGVVQFRSATLVGGSLETEGSGEAKIESSTDFENVTNKGNLNIPGGGSEKLLSVRGATFVNNGVVNVGSTVSGNARIRFTSSVELNGEGEIVLSRPIGSSTLTIESGFTVTQAAGHTIRGKGQLLGTSGTLINNGTVAGASSSEMMDVNVILKGTGLLRDVFIDGTHAPGDPDGGSPTASVPIEGEYNFGNGPGINTSPNRLEIELGGTTPGTEYDQLVSTDPNNHVTIRTFGSVLDVSLVDLGNNYIPTVGDRFTILSSPNNIIGDFSVKSLPSIGLGRSITWGPIDRSDPTKYVLQIASVNLLGADFDEDGDVDGDDLAIWQGGYSTGTMHTDGDADGDGDVDGRDFLAWQRQYTGPGTELASVAIPEPGAFLLIISGTLFLGHISRLCARSSH